MSKISLHKIYLHSHKSLDLFTILLIGFLNKPVNTYIDIMFYLFHPFSAILLSYTI